MDTVLHLDKSGGSWVLTGIIPVWYPTVLSFIGFLSRLTNDQIILRTKFEIEP